MTKKINKGKTYVFSSDGEFLRARETRAKAILGTKELNCLFFSKEEIKRGVHTRLFKKINKHKK